MDDLRFILRQLSRAPAFVVAAILTLALSIGANTAIYSAVHHLLVAPLPYSDVGRVAILLRTLPAAGSFTEPRRPETDAVRARTRSFVDAAAFARASFTLVDEAGPEQLDGARIEAGLLHTLGMRPVIGRGFTADDTLHGATRVVLLGHALWRTRFGGTPAVLGRTIRIDDEPTTIVGVLPRDFTLPWTNGDQLWMPLRNDDPQAFVNLLARLRPGVTTDLAAREARQILASSELAVTPPRRAYGTTVVPVAEFVMHGFQVTGIRTAVLVLFAAVGVVLLIACANVANLLLARAWLRQRELAIRGALGATRWRLVRLMLTESLVLAVMGGGLGALLGWRGLALIVSLRPERFGELSGVRLDPIVLGWTLGLSLLAGLVFGIAPAVFAGSADLARALKVDTRATAGSSTSRHVRSTLVVAEVALSVVLLAGAALLVRSLAGLYRVDPGVDVHRLAELSLELRRDQFPGALARGAAQERVRSTVRALRGVHDVSLAVGMPPAAMGWGGGALQVEGRGEVSGGQRPKIGINYADPDLFRTARLPVLRGRVFAAAGQDTTSGFENVDVVVSETFARQLWPHGDALGKRFRAAALTSWMTIVGICADARVPGTSGFAAQGHIYRSLPYGFGTTSIVVRGDEPLATLVPRITAAVAAAEPRARIRRVRTAEDMIADAIAMPRFVTALLGTFALLALTLSVLGLYGVISYTTRQRTREIGVRVALGARADDILRLVVGDGLRLAMLGAGLGLVGAFAATRSLRAMLYAVEPGDPATLAAVVLLVIATAAAAAYVPARRATRVDPLEALRSE